MYFTRFGYFVIFSIIGVAVAAVLLIVWPFGGGDDGENGDRVVATQTSAPPEAPVPTETAIPALSFQQVVNFANAGAVVDIVVTGETILVNLNPAFDTSGLGTNSHTFTTTLPPGQTNVEDALRQNGVPVGGENGVPVVQQ